MISRLYLDNFHVHRDVEFHFQTGLTGITGPNESGKSLITEGIRYALFGSAALRATAPKNLHVELDFQVAGISYTVIRKGSTARLGDLAIGTRPVNAAIIAILGYDLQVFDVANSCNQGSVEALSDMKPTERKAMVDRTVGLDTLDVVLKYLGERGNALKSQAMGMRAALVVPVAPEPFEGYTTSGEIRPLIAAASANSREHSQILGFLSAAPALPAPPRGRTVEALRPLRAAAADQAAELAELARHLATAPTRPVAPAPLDLDNTVEDLEEYENLRLEDARRRVNLERQRDTLETATFNLDELQLLEKQHENAVLWSQRKRLLVQGHICCPSCNHTWPVADNIPEVEETAAPSVSLAEIRRQRGLQGNAKEKADIELAIGMMTPMTNRSADLRALKNHAIQMAAHRLAEDAYQWYLGGLDVKRARHEELAKLPDERSALDAENTSAGRWATYDAFEAEAVEKRVRLAELGGCEDFLATLTHLLAECTAYEQDLARFNAAKTTYDQKVVELDAVTAKSETYLKARMDVFDLKTRVKSFLLPSLNKVASHLINQMTGGARHSVVVDDDFDIQIDGAPIQTLSGSGKAVANLSIRIALGQILTNRVLSVFMADEVDGSMDADRADYVAHALQRLTAMVKQVILITHKCPETDHKIELRK